MEEKEEESQTPSVESKEIVHPVSVLSVSPGSSASLSGSSEKSLLESNDELSEKENSDLPSIEDQRNEIISLINEHQANAQEGDKMYVIPKFWYDYFFNEDIDDTNLVGPIDTSLICNDYKNFALKDYNQCPYISIPELVFLKFVEWYGLTENSQPASTKLILDKESNTLITEYNKCFFRIQYLMAPEERSQSFNNRHVNNINFFTSSCIDTISDALQETLNFFFQTESNLNIKKTAIRVWLVKDEDLNENSGHLVNTYVIMPIDFISYPEITRIKPELFQEELRNLNITAGTFIVEIKQHHKNYHWASNYFHYNKFLQPKGTVGLSNLGNTCYMNSGLQCLVHIPQLKDYFIYNGFEQEINKDNPLGYEGNIARSFHDLIQNLWGETLLPLRPSFSPNHFKSMVGHCNSMFSGYMQQDSQEFLAFLLDSLHEDLNRIIKKPYVEKPSLPKDADIENFDTIKTLAEKTWESHLLRNDSVITDLFVGMYKSTLECPECSMVSITFDPYSDITLPLPVNSVWHTKVRIFPQNLPPCIIEVELPKNATYTDLKKYVSKCISIDVDNLYGCEIFSHQFYNNFELDDSNSQYLPLQELISESDIVIFYEIPAEEDNIIIPVVNTCVDSEYSSPSMFGVPFFLVLKQKDLSNPTYIRRKLEDIYVNLSGGFIPFNHTKVDNESISLENFPLLTERYPSVNFSTLEDILKYATPEVESGKPFFTIKVLDDFDRKERGNPNDKLSKFWTPRPHTNVRYAQDFIKNADAVIRDIFYYPKNLDKCKDDTENGNKNDDDDVDDHNSAEDIPIDNSDGEEEVEMEVDEPSNDDKSDPEVGVTVEENAEAPNNEGINSIKHDLLTSATFLVCEWKKDDMEEAFSNDKVINWKNPGIIPNKELEEIQMERSSQKDKKITLHDCLSLFSKKEVLGLSDSWYCPNCKEHRQATKRIQLWNTPDIMLMHLKRFESTRSFSDKIDDVVHFPITELDISEHVVYKDDPNGYIYDLIAVDNHYGGLGGGHYTAYVKNFADEKWYYFDDSRVSETQPENSIAGSAYLLFYLRRGSLDKPGKLKQIIESSREAHQNQINEIYHNQDTIFKDNKTDSENSEVELEGVSEEESEEDPEEESEDESEEIKSDQSEEGNNSDDKMDIVDDNEQDDSDEDSSLVSIPPAEENTIETKSSTGTLSNKPARRADILPSPAESISDFETENNRNESETINVATSSDDNNNEYNIKTQEVGLANLDDVESVEKEHIGRRKLRLLSKDPPSEIEEDTTDPVEKS